MARMQALDQLHAAFDALRSLYGAKDRRTLAAQLSVGRAMRMAGQGSQAAGVLTELVQLQEEVAASTRQLSESAKDRSSDKGTS